MTRRFELGSSFGVMQGRLSAQTDLGYQAFPWETWEAEFALATKLTHRPPLGRSAEPDECQGTLVFRYSGVLAYISGSRLFMGGSHDA